MRIPSELIPYCPHCGSHMTVNLRSNDNFVEDRGRLQRGIRSSLIIIEMEKFYTLNSVSDQTHRIIKFPFWKMTYYNRDAVYACVNYGEACAPRKIADRAICINGDAGSVISDLLADIELLKAR